MDLYLTLGLSLGLTLLIECTVAALCRRPLLPTLAVNLLTNPPLVLLWQMLGASTPFLLAGEAVVWAAEGGIYRFLGERKPFRFAVLCNGLSFLSGIILGGIL